MGNTNQVTDPVTRRFLDSRLPDIERIFKPEHIILFGSRATGHAKEDSDIDLILVSQQFEGVRFAERIARFLKEIRSELEIEPLCYTPEEFETLRGQVSIVAKAAREGIWIQ